MKEINKVSRRGFLGSSAAVAAGITLVPSNTIAGLGHKAPSDKLNIVGVGVGGMGFGNLKNMASENIV
ncbi:MAG TPA: twin-arginine translocation signal domain-containing protein, partial [Prolixibacteraceae bacterium]|nr:twin-arginine translocation signal domain-containing protein [Prolixibacteraceae bacterium]